MFRDSRALIVSRTSPDAFWRVRLKCAEISRRDQHGEYLGQSALCPDGWAPELDGVCGPSSNQGRNGGTVGDKIAESVPPLLNNALSKAIASNSDTLISAHANASSEARRTALL